jgi:two-component system OmpR family sensor kinase
MTLRHRLVTLIVTVVLLVSTTIAIVLALALRANLYGQLDGELRLASNRAVSRPLLESGFNRTEPDSKPDQGDDDSAAGRIPLGQAAGTITITYFTSVLVDAGYIDESGTYQTLTLEQFEALDALPNDGRIAAVKVPDLGTFHAISQDNRSGNRTITAMSTASASDSLRVFVGVEAVLIVVAVGAAGWAGTFFIRRALRPLDAVAATATQVSELPLAQGEVAELVRVPQDLTDESTEVGKVGAALNRMLGHVQGALAARHESETQVRQFVADASHELRTPLASIRGYAELVRRSGETVPEGAGQALGRIESESIRMSGLVEDLLLLAHLDAGRELAHDTVDLSMLSIMTLSDAHAAGPNHVWNLDIPEEPCEVIGDEARLQQVLVNLLANSRVHTPEGTEVTLALTPQDDGGMVISVSNNGPEIPTELRSSLFQRFSRGDTSRNRTGGSTGLGLAIAQAIVTAHGGTITVESSPERTTFSVVLPPAGSVPIAEGP